MTFSIFRNIRRIPLVKRTIFQSRPVANHEMYGFLDKDGDGEISPIEFRGMEVSTEYNKAYKLFDEDGDHNITPEELIKILVKLGEVPTDLIMYFNDMTIGVSTDYRGVVNFLTVLMKYGMYIIKFLLFVFS